MVGNYTNTFRREPFSFSLITAVYGVNRNHGSRSFISSTVMCTAVMLDKLGSPPGIKKKHEKVKLLIIQPTQNGACHIISE